MQKTLKCAKCQKIKLLSKYCRNKSKPSGYSCYCKECDKKIKAEYRRTHKEEISAYGKKYRKENPEKVKKQKRNWIDNNFEYCRKYASEWREKNLIGKNYYYKRTKAQQRARYRKRAKNPIYRLNSSIRVGIYDAIKGDKPDRTFEILGYSLEDLARHLELQFTDDMSWENYGKWHIDHIIPISFFEYISPDDIEFKMCWRLENLQPLWAKDNMIKSNKVSLQKAG